MDTPPFSDRLRQPQRARPAVLLRWLATMVLLLGLGGPLSSLRGGEAVASAAEVHAEVVSSPAPGNASHTRRTHRVVVATAHAPVHALDERVRARPEHPLGAGPGVAALPDPRGPPPLQLG